MVLVVLLGELPPDVVVGAARSGRAWLGPSFGGDGPCKGVSIGPVIDGSIIDDVIIIRGEFLPSALIIITVQYRPTPSETYGIVPGLL